MGSIEDRNYWNDRRVKVRPYGHEAWEVDESRMVALIPVPDYCWTHGEGEHDEHPECVVCRKVAIYEKALGAARERNEWENGRLVIEVPEGEGVLSVPFKWEVCGTCNGKGSHVNPSIDCGGISGEDFEADPDFAESYMSGQYDVACSECGGRRVTPELVPHTADEKAIVAGLEREERDNAAYERECRAERAMGA